MKRLVCSFLAFMLLLSLLPLTFQVAATDVVWSGSGDEVRANITINNTKSYTLEYDLHLPGIGTGTNNDTFADDVMLKIRQTTADHYIIFRVKSYRNAEGKFQIQGQQQFYDGNWSAEVTEWSDNMDAPVSDIHVHIAFDTAALTYTWTLSDRNGSRLCGGTTDPKQLSDAYKSATACELSFKRGNSGIVPTNTVYTEDENGVGQEFDETKTPADFGWETDGGNYTGWKVSADGSILQVTYDGKNSKRIWKELIADSSNFSISFDVQVLNKRVELELLGVKFELNTEGGNGNQIYTKDTDWFRAAGQKCHVTMTRENGGALQVRLDGDESVEFTKTVSDEENRNVFLGVIDSSGSACFRNISSGGTEPEPADHTPGEFGWQTDEDSFDGWTATDAKNITVDASKASDEGWIYKDLITDQVNFTVSLDLVPGTESSGAVKVMGVEIELDSRHGHGNQVCVKIGGTEKGWLESRGRETHIELKRTAGGSLEITITGAANDQSMHVTQSAAEESARVSLCGYAGLTSFRQITVVALGQPIPTYTVTWDVGGLKTSETYEEGSLPSFKGDTAKPDDAMYTYVFTGWDKALVPVTADTTYTAVYSSALREITPDDSYADVRKTDWFYADVYTASGYGLMNGTATGRFGPEENMTRAMLVTVLYRLEGKPEHTADNPFRDVAEGTWYYDGVLWAAENGIVNGVGNGRFAPEDDVTREQIATVLMRYAAKKGYDVNRRESIAYYPDSGKVSDYARSAVSWAVAEKLIQGSKENGKTLLLPQEGATRSQVAAILVRFIRKYAG